MLDAKPGIGLVLSGGGFRATLFHLRVVRYLAESGHLKQVSHICSVSGGSILAAHLVLNWERFVDSADEEFEAKARPLLEFVTASVRLTA
jgi:predicted acylesterase/phospholipase RssA